jgi:hypothetical protein
MGRKVLFVGVVAAAASSGGGDRTDTWDFRSMRLPACLVLR